MAGRLSIGVSGSSGGGTGRVDRGAIDGPALSIDIPAKDVSALFKAMARGQKELGWSLPRSVWRASWNVVEKLGTSTNVADPFRKFSRSQEEDKARKLIQGRNQRARKRGQPEVKVPYPLWKSTDKNHKFQFRAANKSEAKKSPFVRIWNRGLAASSWAWGMGVFGRRGNVRGATRNAKNLATRHIQVSSDKNPKNPWVKITNRLGYIMNALKGSGYHAVDSAMRRAASGLEKEITKTLERKMIK